MSLRDTKETSVVTIGNAAEVISRVVVNIAGNDISSNLGGSHITLNAIRELSIARMTGKLTGKTK